ncbi:MAG: tRNA lysidine(34) synthetase TilS [Chthoniobacteraceae bacterium]
MRHTTAIIARLQSALSGFSPKERALVGVSGGADSVALLHLLREAGYGRLIVCHLDHGLRGRQARADAKFVEKLAGSLDLPFVGERIDTKALAKEQSISIETAARAARYAFFGRVARRRRCRTLLLAHHADDQVETFLHNLFRGTGPAGLAAMRPVSERRGLTLLRPLLSIWRTELLAWLTARRLKFREDPSNADPRFTRNRIRHQMIPAIEEIYGREIRPALWRAAELTAADNEYLTIQTGEVGAGPLSVKTLREMPLAILRRTLLLWLRAGGVPDAGFAEVELIRSLLEPDPSIAKVNLPGARYARRRAGKLFLE